MQEVKYLILTVENSSIHSVCFYSQVDGNNFVMFLQKNLQLIQGCKKRQF